MKRKKRTGEEQIDLPQTTPNVSAFALLRLQAFRFFFFPSSFELLAENAKIKSTGNSLQLLPLKSSQSYDSLWSLQLS